MAIGEEGHFGPWTVHSPALTVEEVRALEDGTEVEIVWSGGNGPHRNRVVFDDRGEPYIVSEQVYEKGPSDRMFFYNPVGTFVGPKPRTEIRLVHPTTSVDPATPISDQVQGQ